VETFGDAILTGEAVDHILPAKPHFGAYPCETARRGAIGGEDIMKTKAIKLLLGIAITMVVGLAISDLAVVVLLERAMTRVLAVLL
jgi:hypothetical protein